MTNNLSAKDIALYPCKQLVSCIGVQEAILVHPFCIWMTGHAGDRNGGKTGKMAMRLFVSKQCCRLYAGP